MIESYHSNASVSSNNSDTSTENFEDFHSYEAKYRNLPRNIRPIVQKLEKLYKNLVKVSGTVSFNTLCLKNKLLPKYTYIDIFEEI